MDRVKIDNFQKAYPQAAFPAYAHVERDASDAIRVSIATKIGAPTHDGLVVVKHLQSSALPIGGIDATHSAFSPATFLAEAELRPLEKVYLNWHRFDDIDQMELAEFDRYFSDIWYPGVDDLDFFDSTCSWIVSIAHHGGVRLFGGSLHRQG